MEIKRKIVKFIMDTKIYKVFIKKILPYLRFSMYYPKFTGEQYLEAYKQLDTGDIVLTNDRSKLTSWLIPGKWSHAGLCITKSMSVQPTCPSTPWEISEMTHEDYTKSAFFDLCRQADDVCILRCKDWDKSYIKNVIVPMCKAFENTKYDVAFTLGVKTLYCSELIYQCDKERRLQVNLEDLAGIGQEYISPDGLYNAKNIEVIYDSSNVDK